MYVVVQRIAAFKSPVAHLEDLISFASLSAMTCLPFQSKSQNWCLRLKKCLFTTTTYDKS